MPLAVVAALATLVRSPVAVPPANGQKMGCKPRTRTASLKYVTTLAVLAFAVAGCGSTGESQPPASTDDPTAVALEHHCVDLWNADGNRYVRKLILVVGAPLRSVSVTRVDGPEHFLSCLLTASNPDSGKAAQFLESSEPTTYRGSTVRGYYRLFGNDTQPSGDLQPSATEWNASADEYGAITVNDDDGD